MVDNHFKLLPFFTAFESGGWLVMLGGGGVCGGGVCGGGWYLRWVV